MEKGDWLVVLATGDHGLMAGTTKDGKVVVELDRDDLVMAFAPHELDLAERAMGLCS